MIVCPARLEPIFSPRPWGSLSLAPFFPDKSKLSEPLGEAWMSGVDCTFADGPFAGQKLGEAWRSMSPEWTGTRADRDAPFPLLVKFIFPEDKLSVQVHPADDYAARHEQAAGGRGKTEMWYCVRARAGAKVMVGLKPGVTLERFKRAIADSTAEDCIEHVPLRAGDAIFVPAGTAHTIGPGLVLCEIQEYSDLTYRVYDYNRRDAHGMARPLWIAPATLAKLRAPEPILWYRRWCWGSQPPLTSAVTPFEHPALEMIHTPGHSSEHHVVWDAERETVFGADLYLGVKVRVTHPWPREDVRAQIASIRKVVALKPKRYFDGHRGLVRDPVAQLTAKADWTEEIVGRIDALIDRGLNDGEIVGSILGGEDKWSLVTGYDYSRRNYVGSVRGTHTAGNNAVAKPPSQTPL